MMQAPYQFDCASEQRVFSAKKLAAVEPDATSATIGMLICGAGADQLVSNQKRRASASLLRSRCAGKVAWKLLI
jgi:hypothetical protein